jgi:hypothetical protein
MTYDPTAGTIEILAVDGSTSTTVLINSAGAIITNNNIPTYAALPTTGNNINDLAIWTSNNKTYRWDGAGWVTGTSDPLPSVSSYPQSGTGTENHGEQLLVIQSGAGQLYWWDTSGNSSLPAWAVATAYAIGDEVIQTGVSWTALTVNQGVDPDSTPQADWNRTPKWERLTPDPVQLAADIAAAGIQTVTTLPTANAASKGDVVILQSDGNLYRCLEDTSVTPSTFAFDKNYSFDEVTGTLYANQITAGTITASHLGANSVTANKILAGAIATGHMGANTIAGDRIAAGTLSASKVDANGISANYIKSGTSALASGISFGLGNNTELAGLKAAGMFTSDLSSKLGLLVTNTDTGGNDAIAAGAMGSSNNAVVGVGRGTTASFTQWESLGALGSGGNGGVFQHYTAANALDNAADLATPTHAAYFTGDVYVNGSNLPFTGSHEALISTTDGVHVGDIVVDTEVITKSDVSNTLCKVALSSESNQKGAVGIYVKGMGDVVPSSLTDIAYVGDGVAKDKQITTKPEYESLVSSTDAIHINSVGEGQVNVCGEGGNLEIGDLIVTSSLAGKGMKQSDDIIRSITVAKVRENVTFSSSTEVKQVACIYLCG